MTDIEAKKEAIKTLIESIAVDEHIDSGTIVSYTGRDTEDGDQILKCYDTKTITYRLPEMDDKRIEISVKIDDIETHIEVRQ